MRKQPTQPDTVTVCVSTFAILCVEWQTDAYSTVNVINSRRHRRNADIVIIHHHYSYNEEAEVFMCVWVCRYQGYELNLLFFHERRIVCRINWLLYEAASFIKLQVASRTWLSKFHFYFKRIKVRPTEQANLFFLHFNLIRFLCEFKFVISEPNRFLKTNFQSLAV